MAAASATACSEYVGVALDDGGVFQPPASVDGAALPDATVAREPEATPDASAPAPPVESLASRDGTVLAFAIEADQLVWLSDVEGVRRCTLGACIESTLVLSPNQSFVPPLALAAGTVTVAEKSDAFGHRRLASAALDGTGLIRFFEGQLALGARLQADATGLYVGRSIPAADGIYSNGLVRLDGTSPTVLDSTILGASWPVLLDGVGGELSAVHKVGATGFRLGQRVADGGVVNGPKITASSVTAMARGTTRTFVIADDRVLACTYGIDDVCSPVLEVADAGRHGALALAGDRLLVSEGAGLVVCTGLDGAPTCSPAADPGLAAVLDVRSFDGALYVLGQELPASDGGARWGVRRMHFSGG